MDKTAGLPPGRWIPPKEIIDSSLAVGRRIAGAVHPFLFNPDLDGVLSAEILRRFVGWTPIGLCACAGRDGDRLWIETRYEEVPPEAAYVDMFVSEPGRLVIDQHIVARNLEHAKLLSSQEEKINPNLIWIRTAESKSDANDREYRWKYPFGVVHFIIAMLESAGLSVPVTNKSVTKDFNVFDLLLRADDAGRTTAYRYRDNALSWWDYLCTIGGKTTTELAMYASSIARSDSERTQDRVEEWFRASSPMVKYLGKDANFARHLRTVGVFDLETQVLVDAISMAVWGDEFGMRAPSLRCIELRGSRGPAFNDDYVKIQLDSPTLFSYAFTAVYGPSSPQGFSSTQRIT